MQDIILLEKESYFTQKNILTLSPQVDLKLFLGMIEHIDLIAAIATLAIPWWMRKMLANWKLQSGIFSWQREVTNAR